MDDQVFAIEGAIFINGRDQGFSEVYTLKELDLETAAARLRELCALRLAVLPSGFKIVYARVIIRDGTNLSRSAFSGPHSPLDTENPTGSDISMGFGPVNKTEDALLIRFETLAGQWANRLLRAVPDVMIKANLLQGEFFVPGSPLGGGTPPAPGTWLEALGNFLAFLIAHTALKKRWPAVPNAVALFNWYRAVFRRTAMRRSGRKFQYVSWVALGDNQPNFGPCGMVIGVSRSCYTADCYFHPPYDTTGEIEYFFVKKTNPWFDGLTVFYPLKEYKQTAYGYAGERGDTPRPWVRGDDGTFNNPFANIFGTYPMFLGNVPFDDTLATYCPPCSRFGALPPTLHLTIIAVTAVSGPPVLTPGMVIPLNQVSNFSPFWVSDTLLYNGDAHCPLSFLWQCDPEGGATLTVTATATPVFQSASSVQVSPFLVQFDSFDLPGELVDCSTNLGETIWCIVSL